MIGFDRATTKTKQKSQIQTNMQTTQNEFTVQLLISDLLNGEGVGVVVVFAPSASVSARRRHAAPRSLLASVVPAWYLCWKAERCVLKLRSRQTSISVERC